MIDLADSFCEESRSAMRTISDESLFQGCWVEGLLVVCCESMYLPVRKRERECM